MNNKELRQKFVKEDTKADAVVSAVLLYERGLDACTSIRQQALGQSSQKLDTEIKTELTFAIDSRSKFIS